MDCLLPRTLPVELQIKGLVLLASSSHQRQRSRMQARHVLDRAALSPVELQLKDLDLQASSNLRRTYRRQRRTPTAPVLPHVRTACSQPLPRPLPPLARLLGALSLGLLPVKQSRRLGTFLPNLEIKEMGRRSSFDKTLLSADALVLLRLFQVSEKRAVISNQASGN